MNIGYSESMFNNKIPINSIYNNQSNCNDQESDIRARFLMSNYIAQQNAVKKNLLFTYNRDRIVKDKSYQDKFQEKLQKIEYYSNYFDKIANNGYFSETEVFDVNLENDDEDHPSNALICKICTCFKNKYPVICINCENVYCIDCAKRFTEKGLDCSFCKKKFQMKDLIIPMRNTVDKITILCPKSINQCEKIILFENIKFHLTEDCMKNKYEIKCKKCEFSAKLCFDENILLDQHLQQCPEFEVKCADCSKNFLRKNLLAHIKECEETHRECSFCELSLKIKDLRENHSKQACLEILKNRYDKKEKEIKDFHEDLIKQKNSVIDIINSEKSSLLVEINSLKDKNNEKDDIIKDLELLNIQQKEFINNLELQIIQQKEMYKNEIDKLVEGFQLIKRDYEQQKEDLTNKIILLETENSGKINQIEDMQNQIEQKTGEIHKLYEKKIVNSNNYIFISIICFIK